MAKYKSEITELLSGANIGGEGQGEGISLPDPDLRIYTKKDLIKLEYDSYGVTVDAEVLDPTIVKESVRLAIIVVPIFRSHIENAAQRYNDNGLALLYDRSGVVQGSLTIHKTMETFVGTPMSPESLPDDFYAVAWINNRYEK